MPVRKQKDTDVDVAPKEEKQSLVKAPKEKRPKLLKEVKTKAEEAGISSVMAKVSQIEKVLNEKLPEKKPRKKRVLSDEQKAVLRERLIKAREVRAGKRPLKVEE